MPRTHLLKRLRQAERELRQADASSSEKQAERQLKRIDDESSDVRKAFLALVFLEIYLASVLYTTTHLDLLLDRSIGYLTYIVSVQAPTFMVVSAIALFFVHLFALSLNARVGKRLQHYAVQFPDRTSHLPEGVLTNVVAAGLTSHLWRFAAILILFLSPLVLLLWIQAKTIVLQNPAVTWMIRALIFVDVALMLKVLAALSPALRSWPWLLTGLLVSLLSFVLSWVVFLVPDETLESFYVTAAKATIPSWVIEPRKSEKTVKVIGSGPARCLVGNVPWHVEPVTKSEFELPPSAKRPTVVNAEEAQIPTCFNSSTTLAFSLAMTSWLGFPRAYVLDGETINGGLLSAKERAVLYTHTQKAPLHPEFFSVLEKTPNLNLSRKVLAYGSFRNAFMPRTWVDANGKPIDLRGAHLQGGGITGWKEEGLVDWAMKNASGSGWTEIEVDQLESNLSYANLSGAQLAGVNGPPVFYNVQINQLIAIQAVFGSPIFAGSAISRSDFRYANLQRSQWRMAQSRQGYTLGSTVQYSDFRFANMNLSNVYRALIANSSFGNSAWINSTLVGTQLESSNFAGVDLTKLQDSSGTTLKDVRLPFAAVREELVLGNNSDGIAFDNAMMFVYGNSKNIRLQGPYLRFVSDQTGMLLHRSFPVPDLRPSYLRRMSGVMKNDAIRQIPESCFGAKMSKALGKESICTKGKSASISTFSKLLPTFVSVACLASAQGRNFDPGQMAGLSDLIDVTMLYESSQLLLRPSEPNLIASRFAKVLHLADRLRMCSFDIHGNERGIEERETFAQFQSVFDSMGWGSRKKARSR